MSNAIQNQFGPYHYGNPEHKKTVTFNTECGKRTFVLILSSAYNAYGLIGPEHNGIVVLDNDNECVILDRYVEESSGYFGPSKRQLAAFEAMQGSFEQFLQHVRNSDRRRHDVLESGILD